MIAWADLPPKQIVNWAHPLNRGRVAWWLASPRSYGSNNWYDLCLGINGAFNQTPSSLTWTPQTNPGGAGAVSGSGATTWIDCGFLPAYNQPVLTVGAWIRTSTSTGTMQALARDKNGTLDRVFQLGLNAGKARFIIFSGGTSFNAAGATTVSDGKWHRIIGTYDGTTVRIYVDKKQDGTASHTGTVDSKTNSMRIGNSQNNVTEPWIGQLNDLFLSSRPWSSAEVVADYWLSQNLYPEVIDWPEDDLLPFPPTAISGPVQPNIVFRRRFEPAFWE